MLVATRWGPTAVRFEEQPQGNWQVLVGSKGRGLESNTTNHILCLFAASYHERDATLST